MGNMEWPLKFDSLNYLHATDLGFLYTFIITKKINYNISHISCFFCQKN